MLRLLHTNDFHGTLTPEIATRIRAMKTEDDALYFDSGDAIKAGNLAVPLRPEAAWGLLAEAGCDASAMGNRESHPVVMAFAKKLEGARHPILVANMRAKDPSGVLPRMLSIRGLLASPRGGEGNSEPEEPLTPSPSPRGEGDRSSLDPGLLPSPPAPSPRWGEGDRSSPPPASSPTGVREGVLNRNTPTPCPLPSLENGEGVLRFERAGLKIGVFGVMVPMVTERMATQAASAYLWDMPIPVALRVAAQLRETCDVVIALTHIGFANDRKLAEAGSDIDVILGGHSHTVLEEPVNIGRAWIAQGGSHGRFVGRYRWDGERLTGGLISLI